MQLEEISELEKLRGLGKCHGELVASMQVEVGPLALSGFLLGGIFLCIRFSLA